MLACRLSENGTDLVVTQVLFVQLNAACAVCTFLSFAALPLFVDVGVRISVFWPKELDQQHTCTDECTRLNDCWQEA